MNLLYTMHSITPDQLLAATKRPNGCSAVLLDIRSEQFYFSTPSDFNVKVITVHTEKLYPGSTFTGLLMSLPLEVSQNHEESLLQSDFVVILGDQDPPLCNDQVDWSSHAHIISVALTELSIQKIKNPVQYLSGGFERLKRECPSFVQWMGSDNLESLDNSYHEGVPEYLSRQKQNDNARPLEREMRGLAEERDGINKTLDEAKTKIEDYEKMPINRNDYARPLEWELRTLTEHRERINQTLNEAKIKIDDYEQSNLLNVVLQRKLNEAQNTIRGIEMKNSYLESHLSFIKKDNDITKRNLNEAKSKMEQNKEITIQNMGLQCQVTFLREDNYILKNTLNYANIIIENNEKLNRTLKSQLTTVRKDNDILKCKRIAAKATIKNNEELNEGLKSQLALVKSDNDVLKNNLNEARERVQALEQTVGDPAGAIGRLQETLNAANSRAQELEKLVGVSLLWENEKLKLYKEVVNKMCTNLVCSVCLQVSFKYQVCTSGKHIRSCLDCAEHLEDSCPICREENAGPDEAIFDDAAEYLREKGLEIVKERDVIVIQSRSEIDEPSSETPTPMM